MNGALRLAAAAAAVGFVTIGLAWLIAPGFASAQMRMPLLDGEGLSTQIADLAVFFLVMGGSIAAALWTKRALWLYAPIMMLTLAAAGRFLAWAAHGAALPLDMIAVELVVAAILLALARGMSAEGAA